MFAKSIYLSRYRNIIKLLILLISFTLPLSIKINSFLIVVLAFFCLGSFISKRKNDQPSKGLLVFFILYFLFAVISLVYSVNINSGLFAVEKKLSLIAFPVIFYSLYDIIKSNKFKNRIIEVFIASNVFSSIFCLFISFYKLYINPETGIFPISELEHPLFYRGFSIAINIHPVYFSYYLSFSLIYIGYHLYEKWNIYKKQKKILILLLCIYITLIIVLLSARTPIIALVIAFFIFLFSQINKPLHFFKGILILLLLLVSMFNIPFVKSRFTERPSFKYDITAPHWSSWNGLTLRFAEWKCSIDVIKSNFFLGVGIGDSEEELLKSYKKNFFTIGYNNRWNSHNEYIQTFLALGFLGVFILMAMLFYPLIISWKTGDLNYFFFLLLSVICFTTESILSVQKGVVFFAFFNSLFVFSNKKFSILMKNNLRFLLKRLRMKII